MCLGYKTSLHMIDIQYQCSKNFHTKCIEYDEKLDAW